MAAFDSARQRFSGNDVDSAPISRAFAKHSSQSSLEREQEQMRRLFVEERLLAYREDLAEWFAGIFKTEITESTLISELGTGVKLCQLAKIIEDGQRQNKSATVNFASHHSKTRAKHVPAPRSFNANAKPGSFFARDNVTGFITYARGLGVDQSVLFEANDLVEQSNVKNVLYSLMELARLQGVIEPPKLIQFERMFESGQNNVLSAEQQEDLIQQIRKILERVGRNPNTPIRRMENGEYMIGDDGPLQIVQLRSHVMVWNAGKWQTLEEYLLTTKKKWADKTPANDEGGQLSRRASAFGKKPARPSLPAVAEPARPERPEEAAPTPTAAPSRPQRPSVPAVDDDLIKRLMEQIDSLKEQLRLLEEARQRDRDEYKRQLDALRSQAGGEAQLRQQLADRERDLRDAKDEFVRQRVQDTGEQASRQREMEDRYKDDIGRLERQLAAERERGQIQQAASADSAAMGARVRELEGLLDKAGAQVDQSREDLATKIRAMEVLNAEQLMEADRKWQDALAEGNAARSKLLDEQSDRERKLRDEHAAELDRLRRDLSEDGDRKARDAGRESQSLEHRMKMVKDAAEDDKKRYQAEIQGLQERLNATRQKDKEIFELQQKVRDAERGAGDAERSLRNAHRDELDEQARQHRTKAQGLEAERAHAEAALKEELESLRARVARQDAFQREAQELADQEHAIQLKRLGDEHSQRVADLQREMREAERGRSVSAGDEADALQRRLRTQQELAEEERAQMQTEKDALRRQLEAVRRDMLDLQSGVHKAEAEAGANALLVDGLRQRANEAEDRADRAEEDAEAALEARIELMEAQASDRIVQAELDNKAALDNLRDQFEADKAALRGRLRDELDLEKSQLVAQGRDQERLLQDAESSRSQEADRQERKIAELQAALDAAAAGLEGEQARLQEELDREKEARKADHEKAAADRQRWMKDSEERTAAFKKELEEYAALRRTEGEDMYNKLERANARIEELRKAANDATARGGAELVERERMLRDNERRRAEDLEAELVALRDKLRKLEGRSKKPRTREEELEDAIRDALEKAEALQAKVDRAKALSARQDEVLAVADDDLDKLVALLGPHDPAVRDKGQGRHAAQEDLTEAEAGLLAAEARLAASPDDPALQAEVAGARTKLSRAQAKAAEADKLLRIAIKIALDRLRADAATHQAQEVGLLERAHAAQLELIEELRAQLAYLRNQSQEDQSATKGRLAELEAQLQKEKRVASQQHERCEDEKAALHAKLEELAAEARAAAAAAKEQRDRDRETISRLEAEIEALRRQLEKNKAAAETGISADDMREYRRQLAAWINELLDTTLTESTLIPRLVDGKVLCGLAQAVDDAEEFDRAVDRKEAEPVQRGEECEQPDPAILETLRDRAVDPVHCIETATPGSEEARTNITNFVKWSQTLGLVDPDIFAPQDVMDENEKAVVFGLFDVARHSRGLTVPELVAEERAQAPPVQEIEEEIVEQYVAAKGDDVDRAVARVLNELPPGYRLRRIGKGRYVLGDDQKVLLIRVLRSTVMVRIGGGWEELKKYLLNHDRSRMFTREVTKLGHRQSGHTTTHTRSGGKLRKTTKPKAKTAGRPQGSAGRTRKP